MQFILDGPVALIKALFLTVEDRFSDGQEEGDAFQQTEPVSPHHGH